MKISRLKYVFAFLLVVTLSVVSVPTVKATGFKITEMDVSNVLQAAKASIDDGDEPDTPAYANTIAVFNAPYAIGSFDPLHFYSIRNTASGLYTKVYALTYAQNSTTKDGVEYAGVGSGDDVGLALAFGLGSLSSAQAADQNSLSDYAKAQSAATQAYIWAVSSGANTRASLSGAALNVYDDIAAKIAKSKQIPTYTYGSENEAKAHPIEMAWNDAAGRYEVTVTDDNGLDTTELINVIIATHQNIHYTKNGNSVTFYTPDQIGTASNPETIAVYRSINNGVYRPGYATNLTTGQRFVYLSASPVAYTSNVSYVSFYTNALRIRVEKALQPDSGKTTNTGDASVEGAVYGVFEDNACTKKVAELVTDADGKAITNPLEYKNYYVKEITQSEGCKIDTNVYEALVDNANTENGQKVITIGSKENIIYGGMRLIVSVSDLSGNTTKNPSVGSTIELVLKSDPSQKYTTTVDANGYAEITDVPYGRYTCYETTRPNVPAGNVQDLMDPMDIFIDREETYVYSKLVNTQVAQRYIKMEIKDKLSNKLITGSPATFKIFDVQNNTYVVQTVTYSEDPNVTTPYQTDTFSTDNRGYVVTAEMLPAGDYRLEEVTAPNGYYNQYAATNTSVDFKVTPNSTENYAHEDVVVTVFNTPQVHEVDIYTAGDVLSGTYDVSEAGQNTKNPAYTAKAIPGARYEITATEDVVTDDQTVQWKAGVVETYTTDETGKFTLKLYAGKYTITQVSVPEGYVLDSTPKSFEYTYQGQLIETVKEPRMNYSLVRQSYDVSFTKSFGDAYYYRQTELEEPVVDVALYNDVTFGIYAKEDIKNALGEVKIPAGTMVNAIRVDSNGAAKVIADLPMGQFYAKELTTNENYELNTTELAINCTPANKTDLAFTIEAGNIVNNPLKVTKVTLTKVENLTDLNNLIAKIADAVADATQGNNGNTKKVALLSDAEYKVFYKAEGNYYPLLEKVDGKLVEVVRTTDENGEIVIEGLPFGDYAVQETKAPKYYDLDDAKYPFTVSSSNTEFKGTLVDERTLVDLSIVVEDEDGNLLKDATVALIDTETENVYTVKTDEDGVALFEGVRAGRYIRKVTGLEEQYVLPADRELYAEEDEEIKETVEVKFVVGNIVVYKTDDETGKPVAGCTFQVLDYETGEVIEEKVTDENGYARFEEYRYGKYLVQESEAAKDYEKSEDVMEVSIVEDGVDVVVSFTNVYTADIAVALYAVIALVSVYAIVKATKRMKRN